MSIEKLVEAVLDLECAGEMHGMTKDEAAVWMGEMDGYSRDEIQEAIEILCNEY